MCGALFTLVGAFRPMVGLFYYNNQAVIWNYAWIAAAVLRSNGSALYRCSTLGSIWLKPCVVRVLADIEEEFRRVLWGVFVR